MCSVSLIRPAPGTLRLVMNRDERRSRAAERLPYLSDESSGPVRLLTHDGAAGGAWAGVNSAGVIAVLLNHTPSPSPTAAYHPVSRGVIVPDLLRCPSRATASRRLRAAWTRSAMAAWTVVLADVSGQEAWRWNGSHLSTVPAIGPWASSSLGDARVAVPRERRWHELHEVLDPRAAQDAWHRDQTGPDPAAWVLMRRSDARTVSRTEITLGEQSVEMRWALLDELGQAISEERLIHPRSGILVELPA